MLKIICLDFFLNSTWYFIVWGLQVINNNHILPKGKVMESSVFFFFFFFELPIFGREKGSSLANQVTRRLCFSIRGSVRVAWSLGLICRSRPPHMSNGKLPFMSPALRPAHPEPQGTVPQVLTLSGGARFIAWLLRRPFLRGCWRGPRHLWECLACLGYGPAPGPT